MTKPFSILALAIATTMLFISGCGSDSTISSAEFHKKADAICGKAHEESFNGVNAYLISNGKDLANSLPTQELLAKAVATATVPALRQGIKELEGLDVSGDDEQNLEAFTAALEKANKTVEEKPKDPRVASAAIYEDATSLAGKYHLGKCRFLP